MAIVAAFWLAISSTINEYNYERIGTGHLNGHKDDTLVFLDVFFDQGINKVNKLIVLRVSIYRIGKHTPL